MKTKIVSAIGNGILIMGAYAGIGHLFWIYNEMHDVPFEDIVCVALSQATKGWKTFLFGKGE